MCVSERVCVCVASIDTDEDIIMIIVIIICFIYYSATSNFKLFVALCIHSNPKIQIHCIKKYINALYKISIKVLHRTTRVTVQMYCNGN